MKKTQPTSLNPERLRAIAWELGAHYPLPAEADSLALYMVTPQQGHFHWHLAAHSVEARRAEVSLPHAPLIVRLYDVSDVIFDGFNAHRFFDFEIHALAGNYYFNAPQAGRTYLAEVGLRGHDGDFHALARSRTVRFAGDGPSAEQCIDGLFVDGKRIVPVESVFDAPLYEAMHARRSSLEQHRTIHVALLFPALHRGTGLHGPLGASFTEFPARLEPFDCHLRLFGALNDADGVSSEELLSIVADLKKKTCKKVVAAHRKQPFSVLHCHDWYAVEAAREIGRTLGLPWIFSLHSSEHERSHGHPADELSAAICALEQAGAQEAGLVIVPHEDTRRQVIDLYGAAPEKVVVVADILRSEEPADTHGTAHIRHRFGIHEDAPVFLFSGEISHATGADLLMEAIPEVCARNGEAIFVFAGGGPLQGELEGRAGHRGVAHRCRFVGDLDSHTFQALLQSVNYVVITARTWQDAGLAQLALDLGKPVLTTHQAGIGCVQHGQNGLVAYDNPGSIVWGLNELLHNNLSGSLLRMRLKDRRQPTLESVIVRHALYYLSISRQ